jgi:hypothetical protein
MKKRTEKAAKFQLPSAKVLLFNQHGKAIELSAQELADMAEDRELIYLFQDTWYTMMPDVQEHIRWAMRRVAEQDAAQA